MEWLLEKDGQLLLWLKETFSHPVLDEMMRFISSLGNKGMIWIAIGVLFLLLGCKHKIWRTRGFLVLFSLAANFLACNVILKPLVDRTRPYYVLRYDHSAGGGSLFSFGAYGGILCGSNSHLCRQ